MRISGSAAAGYSTGDAMAEMEKFAAQLPQGFGFEWTASRAKKAGRGTGLHRLCLRHSGGVLCLAALYESWTIPLSVILVVPLGVVGVLLATLMRGYANDVYFQVGLITIIGLSAKNAILIIEFAKDLQAEGKSVVAAALEAAHLRFRPIVMTSLAFTMGVLPLALASGAGSASQRAIGTGVIGGMLTGTILAVVFVPVFWWCAACSGAAHASRRCTASTPNTWGFRNMTDHLSMHTATRAHPGARRARPALPAWVAVGLLVGCSQFQPLRAPGHGPCHPAGRRPQPPRLWPVPLPPTRPL